MTKEKMELTKNYSENNVSFSIFLQAEETVRLIFGPFKSEFCSEGKIPRVRRTSPHY